MAIKKFTFKRNHERYYSDTITIKYGPKHQVGTIRVQERTRKAYIMLMITQTPTKDDPAPFRWITLKGTFDSLEQARDRLSTEEAFTALTTKYCMHRLEVN